MSHSRDGDHLRALCQQGACNCQELRLGDEFFDPDCGCFYPKVSDGQGRCLIGGDGFEGALAAFEPACCVPALGGRAESASRQQYRGERE